LNERDSINSNHENEIQLKIMEIEMLQQANNEMNRTLISYDQEYMRLNQTESDYGVLKAGYNELTESYRVCVFEFYLF
jgi:hypothetical protein